MNRTIVAHSNAMFEEFLSLEKQAAAPGVLSRVGKFLTKTPEATAWTGRGAGALIGAGAGAGLAAAGAPEGERGKRALIGGLTGGVLGLGAGQFATGAGRQQMQRFGQRQLHSLTGYMPGHGITGRGISRLPESERAAARMQGLRKMRMEGSGWRAEEAARLKGLGGADNVERAKELLAEANPATLAEAQRKAAEGMKDSFLMGRLTEGNPELRQRLVDLKARFLYAPREAAETGATSIPGIIRGAVLGAPGGQGRAAVLRSGALASGGLGLGLGGASAVMGAPEVIRGTGSYEGLSPYERAGRYVGDTAGWTIGSSLPVVGGFGLGTMGGKAGELLGRGLEAGGRSTVGFVRRGLTPEY